MTTLYDHSTTPPTRYSTAGSCVAIPRLGSVPVTNPPDDIYPDAGRDSSSIAAGHRATGWHRVVRDGKSVEVPASTEAIPLAELQAGATSGYQAEAAEMIRANLPQPWDALRFVATVEFQAWAEDYLATIAAELSRLEDAVSAATSAAEVDAITANWPEVAA